MKAVTDLELKLDLLYKATLTFAIGKIFGNKAKGRISKRMFQENKTRQIFRKTKNTITAEMETWFGNKIYMHNKPCKIIE